jgi:hypothetical protein
VATPSTQESLCTGQGGMTSQDTGHQKRFGRGFIQRVGELFSANVFMSDPT